MDPQTQALVQALSGQGASPGALSPFAPGAMQAANQQAYALPQDLMAMQPSGMQPQAGGPPPTGQNASLGDQSGLSLGAGQQNMYSAMMQPPPAPNYWG